MSATRSSSSHSFIMPTRKASVGGGSSYDPPRRTASARSSTNFATSPITNTTSNLAPPATSIATTTATAPGSAPFTQSSGRLCRSASFTRRNVPPPPITTTSGVSAVNMPSYRFTGTSSSFAANQTAQTPTPSVAPVNFNSSNANTSTSSSTRPEATIPRRLSFRSGLSNSVTTTGSKHKFELPSTKPEKSSDKSEKASKNFQSYGNQLFDVGHSDTMGRRPTMEDSCVSYGEFAGVGTQYYAIFDGHGGPEVSAYCASNLHQMISDYYENGNSFVAATKKAIKDVNDYVVDKWPQAGSTAAIAIVDDDVLYTANVGDSRIVLVHNGKAKRLSVDHKAVSPDEMEAIIKRGGSIQSGRVNGILMLSRAIGDGTVARFITSEPFMTQTILKDNARLILACDGVWDVMDDQYAADIFLQVKQPEEAAKVIKSEALRRGTMDNVSVICVDLKL